jgi:hypothetical protein
LLWPAYQRVQLGRWLVGGKASPPPHIVKQRILIDYAQSLGLRTLVETGTYLGDMIWALRNRFDEIHSVELDANLFGQARGRFAGYPHIHLYQGDSGAVLPAVVRGLAVPALFWLDGHYSGGDTARGDADSPVARELLLLLEPGALDHVILIDDARLFTGEGGYPDLESLRRMVVAGKPASSLEIIDDVIRIAPVRPAE